MFPLIDQPNHVVLVFHFHCENVKQESEEGGEEEEGDDVIIEEEEGAKEDEKGDEKQENEWSAEEEKVNTRESGDGQVSVTIILFQICKEDVHVFLNDSMSSSEEPRV